MHRTLLAATLAASLFSTTPVLEPLWRHLASLWGQTGCHIDPGGRCLPGSTAGAGNPGDEGCEIDPDGDCASATTQADSGCEIDPDGRCAG